MVKFVRGGAALRESLTRAPSIVAMRALLARAADEPFESPDGATHVPPTDSSFIGSTC